MLRSVIYFLAAFFLGFAPVFLGFAPAFLGFAHAFLGFARITLDEPAVIELVTGAGMGWVRLFS